MTGEEIKALRRTLDLTARRLGEELGVDQATVLAWEREDLFPTRRHVTAMQALLARGRIEARGEAATATQGDGPFSAMRDPAVWRLFRKLVAHAELRREVEAIAERYADPGGD